MIHFKSTVNFKDLSTQILFAITVADQCNTEVETWITSLNDSVHKEGSLHYLGLAVDLRTRNHSSPNVWFEKIKKILSPHFTVLFEDQGGPNEHIHIQYGRRSDHSVS